MLPSRNLAPANTVQGCTGPLGSLEVNGPGHGVQSPARRCRMVPSTWHSPPEPSAEPGLWPLTHQGAAVKPQPLPAEKGQFLFPQLPGG